MSLPKFILGDNTDHPNAIYVVHTEFPRWTFNVRNHEIEWLEDFNNEDQKELLEETEVIVKFASEFYDREVSRYED